MLETLQQTNIGTLTLEEPRPTQPIAPTEVLGIKITEKDWENVRKLIKINTGFPDLSAYVKLLSPERYEWLNLTRHEKAKIIDRLAYDRWNNLEIDPFYYAFGIKVLAPELAPFIMKRVESTSSMNLSLEMMRKSKDYSRFADSAATFKIVLPEEKLDIKKEDFEFLGTNFEFDYMRNGLDTARRALRTRILFPERFQEINSQMRWYHIQSELEYFYELQDWGILLPNLFAVKALQAESIELTSNGLKLINPGEEDLPFFTKVIPPLPEVRKF